MRGKIIGLAFILCVCIVSVMGSAFATSFTVNATALQNRIFSDEVAQYTLTIKNQDSMTGRYTIASSDPSWRLVYEGDVVSVNPGQQAQVNIQLTPTESVQDGKVYAIPVTVKSLQTNEQYDLKLEVILDSASIREYKPSISVDVVAGDQNKIDPTRPVDIVLRFTNKNPLDVKSLQVKVSSPLFTDQFTTTLAPSDAFSKIITEQINPQAVPQNFSIDVELVANNISLGLVTRQSAQIIAAEPGFTRDVKTDLHAFLYREYIVELTNPGNVQSTETVQMQSSLWQRLFTKSDFPVTYTKEDGKYYANFAVTIGPGAGVEFSVVQNYKPFVYTTGALILLILVGTVLYFTFRSSIIVTRKVQIVTGDDDGVSRMKVVLNIKNRTGAMLENVKVVERTPNITEVDKQFVVGTLKPTKIVQNAVKGTLVRWDFTALEPFEERIITYNINSKLAILGTMQLPPTLVKYDRSGQTRTVSESSHDDFI